MNRFVSAGLAVTSILMLAATPAVGETTTLPGGTSLSVDIDSPTAGSFVEGGNDLTVTGTASVDTAVAVPDTSIVYLIDVSGSMHIEVLGIDCPTVNSGYPSRLDCAKKAAIIVNDAAIASGTVLNGAVIPFSRTASTLPGQGLTDNLASLNGFIAGLSTSRGTNYQAAVTQASKVLADSSAADNKTIIIISDGVNGGAVSHPELPSGTVIHAFAIGGNGCGVLGAGTLADLAALTEGGSCEAITNDNLGGLGDIIDEAIGSTLDSVTVTVDGAPITAVTVPSVPQTGPVSVSFTATVPEAQLPLGRRTLCATATGTTADGSGSVTECVTVDIVDATVDCGAVAESECTLQANDGNVAVAVVRGLGGFDKTLAITAGLGGADGDCLGQDCITAFNVQFPDEGLANTGKVVELVVTMSRTNSTPPGLAKAFLEVGGVTTEITSQCGGPIEILPCVKITRVKGGRTQYVVKFDGDPFAKFR